MPWQDQMRPATFRGVTFHVESSEQSGGRRGVTFEYPFRDEPFREDLGRKARSFQVEGYVIGLEYLDARNALLEALEREGPGELVHPLYGTRRVAVETFRVRETTDRGGMAVFSIQFIETPAQPAQPVSAPDSATKAVASAASAREAVGAEFLATYSPGFLLDSVATALRGATNQVNAVLSTVTMEEQQIATLRARVDAFEASVSAIVDEPADMLSGLTEIFDLFPDAGSVLRVYDFDTGVRPPATTSNREQEQANFDATVAITRRLAVIRAAELAPFETYDSYDAAVDRREAITDLLDEQADVAPDDTYPALLQLRADLVKAVPGENSDLPRLVRHTPPATIPSLVLAHQLYGDLDLETDLVTRNRIRNPLFVRGGVELEVLSRG